MARKANITVGGGKFILPAKKELPEKDSTALTQFILPAKKELPKKDPTALTQFIDELAKKVMKAASPVGDQVKLVVGKLCRLVKITDALEEARYMLYEHYRLGTPPRPEPRRIPVGLGLQIA